MEPVWYKIRQGATLTAAGLGIALLLTAYLLAGDVTRWAQAWMALLGLAIPVGVWVFVTLVGWQRRSSGFRRPHLAIAWANDPHRFPLLLAGFFALLFLLAYQVAVEVKRGGAERAMVQAFEKSVRHDLVEACRTRAAQLLDTRATADVDLRDRVPHFCTCLDVEIERVYTPEQFAEVPKEQWWTSGDAKVDRIVQKCRINDSSLVRAARIVRAKGTNPETKEMQAEILAYAACVRAELEQRYTGAAKMMASNDLAWQDGNDRFRQIVAHCTEKAGW